MGLSGESQQPRLFLVRLIACGLVDNRVEAARVLAVLVLPGQGFVRGFVQLGFLGFLGWLVVLVFLGGGFCFLGRFIVSFIGLRWPSNGFSPLGGNRDCILESASSPVALAIDPDVGLLAFLAPDL